MKDSPHGRLTPIDIQQQQFGSAFRGFDRAEVQHFLDLLAQQLAEQTRENNELRVEVRRGQRELDELRSREESLKGAMLTAQRAIDDIREQANKEAQLILSDAELRAEKILHSAHGRVTKIVEEMNDLRRQRVRFIEELRGVVNTHARLLDVHVADAREVASPEVNVTVLDRLRAPAPPSMDEARAQR